MIKFLLYRMSDRSNMAIQSCYLVDFLSKVSLSLAGKELYLLPMIKFRLASKN